MDEDFFGLGTDEKIHVEPDTIILNGSLAEKLDTAVGDEVLVRITMPSDMNRDIVLSQDSDLTTAFRLKISEIIGEDEFGNFNLRPDQKKPANAFVDRQWLGEKINQDGLANMLLTQSGDSQLLKDTLANTITPIASPMVQ